MKIDRSPLTNELFAFARAGDGVVVGRPGVGKSRTLVSLCKTLQSARIPTLPLAIDQLGNGTEEEMRRLFPGGEDWIGRLRDEARASGNVPGVLIFDGFDAARSEAHRAEFLARIRTAINELRGFWNVVVSVRTFDATKSAKLLDLFPGGGDGGIACRHFVIPELNDGELEQVFDQMPPIRALHRDGSEEFRRLLRIPFHLWLLEQILKSDAASDELSQITSEVQLLDRYWQLRVLRAPERDNREHVLNRATREMVQSHSLSVRKDAIFDPAARDAWEGLFSDEVLIELPTLGRRVMFSHNILFDYAVSALLLEERPEQIAEFIAAEPARPLFLRPSLVYHYTRLWHGNRTAFWENYWSIIENTELHLRQIVRLVVPTVVVSESRHPVDLVPLIERLRERDPSAGAAWAFLLQAIRVLGVERPRLWSEVLCEAAGFLDRTFAWDLGVVAQEIHKARAAADSVIRDFCGTMGRGLLRWAWAQRTEKRDPWAERLSAFLAIPLVAKTFDTAPDDSRELLRTVIDVIGEPDFPIQCIDQLADDVEAIVDADAEFAAELYERVFRHVESSDAPTHMGGHILNMISNRRQDYNGVEYRLNQSFPKFLLKAPEVATRVALRVLNAHAWRRHVALYLKPGVTIADIQERFEFRGRMATFIKDGSAIWDRGPYQDQELEFAHHLFARLAALAREDRQDEISAFLDIFAEEAAMAFLWARLFSVGAEAPSVFASLLWPTCTAPALLRSSDVLFQLGAFIEAASPFVSDTEVANIELAITALVDNASDSSSRETWERWRNRLLARLPAMRLTTAEAIQIRTALDASGKLEPNRPLVEFSSSWSEFTEDDYLKEQGAKPLAPENAVLRALYEPIRAFERKWQNKEIPENEIGPLIPTARELFSVLRTDKVAEAAVRASAWTHLSSFVHVACRQITSGTDKNLRFFRDVLVQSARHPDPIPGADDNETWLNATWSPAPRNEAAQALPWLMHLAPDDEIMSCIEALVHDPVPSVRFLIAGELWRITEHLPEASWRLLTELAEREPNRIVLDGSCVSLWRMRRFDALKSIAVLKILFGRIDTTTLDRGFGKEVVCMVTDDAIWNPGEWSESILATWREDAIASAPFLAESGHWLVMHVRPQQEPESLARARALLIGHISAVARGLGQLKNTPPEDWNDDLQKVMRQLYHIIDDAVLRIYFAADVEPHLKQRQEFPLDDRARERFFREALPVLQEVVRFALDPQAGMLFAPTAHHFMELLNGVLQYDPPLALHLASEVVRASKPHNYTFDSMAMREVAELVQTLLADHRAEIQADASITDLLNLLDAFVEAGWPDALKLVWRLDEIYR